MSVRPYPQLAPWVRTRPGSVLVRRRTGARTSAAAGLALCLIASVWIAVGAADGHYLLELPTPAQPGWVEGPLHGLSTVFGALGSIGLSIALLMLAAGYVLALSSAQAISLRTAMIAVALANLAFTLGPSIVSSDVFGYIAYAREFASHGLDPYVSPPLVLGRDHLLQFVYWKHQPSPYGPLFTFVSAPLGLLSSASALWAYKAVAGVAAIATAYLVARLAARRGVHAARAAIFVGLNPALLVYAVSGAHNDLLATVLVVCALALTVAAHERLGGAAAVGAAAIKLTAGLALPFVVFAALRRRRALEGVAIAAVAIGLPAVLLFGLHFFDQLHRISTDPLFDTVFSGPDRLATLLGGRIDSGVRALSTGFAAAVAVAMLVRAWRGGDAITAAGWATLALIASIASLAPWYVVWLLPLAALAHSRPLRLATLALSAYLVLAHTPILGGVPWLSQAGAAGAPHEIAAAGELTRAVLCDGVGCGSDEFPMTGRSKPQEETG